MTIQKQKKESESKAWDVIRTVLVGLALAASSWALKDRLSQERVNNLLEHHLEVHRELKIEERLRRAEERLAQIPSAFPLPETKELLRELQQRLRDLELKTK